MSGPFRLDDDLARIGLRGPLPPTLATFAAVQAAHVDAIPFENLDPLLRRPVDLDPDALQAKLVDDRPSAMRPGVGGALNNRWRRAGRRRRR